MLLQQPVNADCGNDAMYASTCKQVSVIKIVEMEVMVVVSNGVGGRKLLKASKSSQINHFNQLTAQSAVPFTNRPVV